MSLALILETMTQGQLNRLNETCAKYTNFESFEALVAPEINYRPVLYYDQEQPVSVRRDLDDVATAYDKYMAHIQDIRRIYRC